MHCGLFNNKSSFSKLYSVYTFMYQTHRFEILSLFCISYQVVVMYVDTRKR